MDAKPTLLVRRCWYPGGLTCRQLPRESLRREDQTGTASSRCLDGCFRGHMANDADDGHSGCQDPVLRTAWGRAVKPRAGAVRGCRPTC